MSVYVCMYIIFGYIYVLVLLHHLLISTFSSFLMDYFEYFIILKMIIKLRVERKMNSRYD